MSYVLSPRRLRIGLLWAMAVILALILLVIFTPMGDPVAADMLWYVWLCPGAIYAPVVLVSLQPARSPSPRMFWRALLFVPCVMAASATTVMVALRAERAMGLTSLSPLFWLPLCMAGALGAGILVVLLAAIFGIRARRPWLWMLPVAAGAVSQLAYLPFGDTALLFLFVPWWWLVSEALLHVTPRSSPVAGARIAAREVAGPVPVTSARD